MTVQLDSASVADYLTQHAGFFEEHAELLAAIKLTSPIGGRAISLQERQMEILREKNKGLELHLAQLIRLGQENDLLNERMQEWNRSLLQARHDADLPKLLADGLQNVFNVPQVTLRLWNLKAGHADAWFAAAVSEDARIFTNGLTAPYCGPNRDFEAAGWLDQAAVGSPAASLAMLPLRAEGNADAFGLLVLGSPDAERFTSDMATDFLARIGETAGAALACLRD